MKRHEERHEMGRRHLVVWFDVYGTYANKSWGQTRAAPAFGAGGGFQGTVSYFLKVCVGGHKQEIRSLAALPHGPSRVFGSCRSVLAVKAALPCG